MAENSNTIERVLSKIEKLGSRVKRAEEMQQALELEKRELHREIEEKNRQITELKEKHEVLKMAKSLAGSSGNSAGVKLKINELVREIDKCIALLNR